MFSAILAGLLTGNLIVGILQLIQDVLFVYRNRYYTGQQLLALLILIIPGMLVFALMHIFLDRLERKYLMKNWTFFSKSGFNSSK